MLRKMCLYVANFSNFVLHLCFDMVPRVFWCYTCRKKKEWEQTCKGINTRYLNYLDLLLVGVTFM